MEIEEKNEKKWIEETIQEITSKKILNLMKYSKLQVQKVQTMQRGINIK